MAELPLHPLFIHMPISVTLLMPAYFIGLVIFRERMNNDGVRASFLFMTFVSFLFTTASYVTGVEDREYSMASSELLNSHYDLALYFFIASVFITAVAAAQVALKNLRTTKINISLLFLSLGFCALVYFVGHTGAEITYGE